MSNSNNLQRVALHYEKNIDYQLTRLEQDSPIEYAITLRKLDKWIPSSSFIADVGTGAGHYAFHLAQKNCRLHLIDLADGLLEACRQKFYSAHLEQQILSVTNASATNLDFIADNSMNAVLLLGPLYHLNTESERRMVIREAHRILKDDGILIAGGINRIAVLKEIWVANRFNTIKENKINIQSIKKDMLHFINSGISSENIFPPLSAAFFSSSRQFREAFIGYFNELEFLGVESFTGHAQQEFFNKAEQCNDWLDLIEITGRTDEGIASSEHFLFIGRKNSLSL